MPETILIPPALGMLSAIAASARGYENEPRAITGVKCVDEDESFTYSATNGKCAVLVTVPKERMPEPTGRFPDIKAVIPQTPPLMTMKFDSKMLRDILLVVQSLGIDFGACVIEWHGEGKPAVIRATDDEGTNMIGLIMPINQHKEQ